MRITHIEFMNNFGVVQMVAPMAEFTDADGNRFFVIPCARGRYDTEPPYRVLQKTDEVKVVTTRKETV